MATTLYDLLPRDEDLSSDHLLWRFPDYVAGRRLRLYPSQESAILELFGEENVILNTPTGSGTMSFQTSVRGRGAASNPPNRFELLVLERDAEDFDPESDPAPATRFFRDVSSSLITYNDSPDLGFAASLNPHRDRDHGSIFC